MGRSIRECEGWRASPWRTAVVSWARAWTSFTSIDFAIVNLTLATAMVRGGVALAIPPRPPFLTEFVNLCSV